MKRSVVILLVLLVTGAMLYGQLYCGNADSAVIYEIKDNSVFFTNMSQTKTITVSYSIENTATYKKIRTGVIQIAPLTKAEVTLDFKVGKVDFTAMYCD